MPGYRRKNLEKGFTFEVLCHPEDMPYKGHCSAIDPETDAATETWIRKELSNGNMWAWCMVEVRATKDDITGVDYLGACSYWSEKQFRRCGYYPDMQRAAIDDWHLRDRKRPRTILKKG